MKINRQQAIEQVYQELLNTPHEEFMAELEKHKDGDIARMLIAARAVLLSDNDKGR